MPTTSRLATALLALALLSACTTRPPEATAPTPSAAAPTAAAPTAAPATPTEAPTVAPSATSAPAGPTATPPLPSGLIDATSAPGLAPVRSLGLGDGFSAAFTQDGAELVAGTSAGLAWFSLPRVEQRRFDAVGPVYDLVFGPGDELLAHGVYGPDGEERSAIRRAADASLVAEVAGGRPAFSPDGALVATGSARYSETQQGWLWRAADGAAVAQLLGAEPRFSPGGSHLVTVEAIYDAPSITRIYAAAGGEPLLELAGERPAFSPDDALIAITGEGQVEVYALPGGDLRATIVTPTAGAASFDAAGRLLIVVGSELLVWDVASDSELARFPDVNRAEEVFLDDQPRFGPAGASVVTFEPSLGDCPPSGVQINATDDGRLLFEDDASYSAAFAPDGARVAALTGNGLRLIDLAEGSATDLPLRSYAAFAFSPDGATLAVSRFGQDENGLLQGRVELWDIAMGRLEQTLLTVPEEFAFSISRLAFSPDGAQLSGLVGYGCAAFGSWKAVAWDVASGTIVGESGDLPNGLDADGAVIDRVPAVFAMAPGEATTAWGTPEGQVVIRQADGSEELVELPAPPTALAFSQVGLLAAYGAGELQYIAVDGPVPQAIWYLEGAARELAFSPDGTRVVALLESGGAQLLAANDMSAIAYLEVAAEASGATLSRDGAVVAVGEAEGAALFDGTSGALLGRIAGATEPAIGPGRRLMGSLEQGRVVLWGAP